MQKDSWTQEWFNEDYLRLYAARGGEEAAKNARFIIKALRLSGNERVLDVGCGSGRYVFVFRELGFAIEGIDFSPFLIEIAKKEAKKQSLSPTLFHLGDIRTSALSPQYDTLLSLFTSFGYFSDAENLNVLKAMRGKVRSKGKLFLDYLNPNYVIEHLLPKEELILNGEKIVIERQVTEGCVEKKIAFPTKEYFERVKLYSLEELTELLHQAGFERTNAYGSFEGEAYNLFSPRLILTAEAK
ncbi:class I SAM-dependent methyltransferase [Estrella lausannensis]|uniref:Methyltransferase n=1 Tax=Estrella lausannensis TaxID=483423 RepID=A0A0H5DRM7_9BACT|nr:class I SAM-dependent methyltransferase [Estrella lausannensis]CRX38364.1 Methyltransferase [Estrella lausannensis]